MSILFHPTLSRTFKYKGTNKNKPLPVSITRSEYIYRRFIEVWSTTRDKYLYVSDENAPMSRDRHERRNVPGSGYCSSSSRLLPLGRFLRTKLGRRRKKPEQRITVETSWWRTRAPTLLDSLRLDLLKLVTVDNQLQNIRNKKIKRRTKYEVRAVAGLWSSLCAQHSSMARCCLLACVKTLQMFLRALTLLLRLQLLLTGEPRVRFYIPAE